MEIFIEIIVESHTVVGNNIERFLIPFTLFSPVMIFGKMREEYHNQSIDFDIIPFQICPVILALMCSVHVCVCVLVGGCVFSSVHFYPMCRYVCPPLESRSRTIPSSKNSSPVLL